MRELSWMLSFRCLLQNGKYRLLARLLVCLYQVESCCSSQWHP